MATVLALSESRPQERTPTGWYKYWQKELTAADKRLRKFRKQGNRVVDRYLDKRSGSDGLAADGLASPEHSLNLFHSNINTMQSMLYGNTPSTDVSREHNDPDDDVARVAAMLYQRILQADVADSGECFPTALRSALMDRLLPGMGVARLRYEYEASTVQVLDPQTMEMVSTEQVDYEAAPIDYIHWQDFSYGWCRTWSELPWMGFRSWLTKEEAKKRFGEKKAKGMTYETQQPTGNKKDASNIFEGEEDNVQKAPVWEIWDKQSKRVFWYNEGCDIVLDAIDDPLALDGFWPAPMPMMANLTTSLYIAQADFITAQDLYNEIDTLQARITNITRAVKVVGVYDKGETGSVGRMLQEGVENDMIPVDNYAMFAEKGGLQGVVDWFPVETIVGTLQTLIAIRDQTIELLNMVTGMSEIMRGAAGGQYTAASSNQLAAKMGSIQVQALQEDFARFASDLQALRAEVVSKHFAPVSIMRQSSAQFVPEADKDKVPAAVELMQSPDIKWRVNIRPESIAMVDYAQLKQERTEFLTAMATYIQSAQAAAKELPGSLPILLEMLKWGMAGFKGSDYLEGTMDQAIEMAKKMPPEKDDGQDQQKAQIEQAKSQAEMAKIQAKSQADMQLIQAKSAAEMQKQQTDFQQDMQTQQQKAQADQQKIMMDLQADLKVIAAKLQADLTVEKAQSSYSIAERQVEHRDAMVELGANHNSQMDLIEEQGEQNETPEDDD